MRSVDEELERTRDVLEKARASLKKELEDQALELKEMEIKMKTIQVRIIEVVAKGNSLPYYMPYMEFANVAGKLDCDAVQFGHQVLLLSSLHQSEVRETLLKKSGLHAKREVNRVEVRKREMREESAQMEIESVNVLTTHAAEIRDFERKKKYITTLQRNVIGKLQWKFSPIHSITALNFDTIMGVPKSASPDTILEEETAKLEAFERSAEFTAALRADDPSSMQSSSGRRVRKLSFESSGTLSTQGEELLQGIQSIFGAGRSGSSGNMSLNNNSSGLTSDDCDAMWSSRHLSGEGNDTVPLGVL